MELEFCEHYKQVGPLDEWSCTAECTEADDVKEAYNSGNKVGVVEGLEMAALYHDGLADRQMSHAVWGNKGQYPENGAALYVDAHRRYASEIRAMKEA